ncbi:MAG: class IV adenylate cyclase [Pyrinomonadaceae bacterium]
MAEEIEKKYRLTSEQRERVLRKLALISAAFEGEDFEENILFRGGILSLKECILRLRKTQDKAILTYKESLMTDSSANTDIKRRIEHETVVADGAAMEAILESLGYRQSLVYEKRRKTWHFENVEVVVDELPFGMFLEIEGEEVGIKAAEIKLGIQDLEVEPSPYPALAARFGQKNGNLIEARFI